jgi:hypothetical protein
MTRVAVQNPDIVQVFFNFAEKVGRSFYSFKPKITYERRCPSTSSQYFISSLVSLLMTSFDVQYPLSAYKSATPLSLHQHF